MEREWNIKKIQQIRQNSKQLNLLDSDKNVHEIFQVVNKLPYEFSYTFKEEEGNKSTLMIEDWEIGALYWNCLRREKDEQKAVEKVREKYLDEFRKKDLHLFLGTTKQFHKIGPNPFIIIGVFYPPVIRQQSFPIE